MESPSVDMGKAQLNAVLGNLLQVTLLQQVGSDQTKLFKRSPPTPTTLWPMPSVGYPAHPPLLDGPLLKVWHGMCPHHWVAANSGAKRYWWQTQRPTQSCP